MPKDLYALTCSWTMQPYPVISYVKPCSNLLQFWSWHKQHRRKQPELNIKGWDLLRRQTTINRQNLEGKTKQRNKQKHQNPLEFFYSSSIPLLARKQERADILMSVTLPHTRLNWTVHRGQSESASLHVLQTHVLQLGWPLTDTSTYSG